MRIKIKFPVLLFLAFLLFSCGQASKDKVTVVTFNMYTGFDVEGRIAEFLSGSDPITVATEIFSEFQATDPNERISLAAREIARLSPDFVGLQEVTQFIVSPLFSIDFLPTLIEQIRKEGGDDYESIVIDNLVLNQTIDTGSFLPLGVTYKDREAVLYRKGFKIEGDPTAINLPSHRDPVMYEGQEIVFYRGLIGARFKWAGEKLISIFSTHLDQAYLGDVQTNQMQDILDILDGYSADENLVLVGDFNSREGDPAYGLVPAAGLTDTFRSVNPLDTGFTCCNVADLSNSEPTADQRIDMIFNKSSLWSLKESSVVLNARNSIWPSDHFGVMTVFEKNKEATPP